LEQEAGEPASTPTGRRTCSPSTGPSRSWCIHLDEFDAIERMPPPEYLASSLLPNSGSATVRCVAEKGRHERGGGGRWLSCSAGGPGGQADRTPAQHRLPAVRAPAPPGRSSNARAASASRSSGPGGCPPGLTGLRGPLRRPGLFGDGTMPDLDRGEATRPAGTEGTRESRPSRPGGGAGTTGSEPGDMLEERGLVDAREMTAI